MPATNEFQVASLIQPERRQVQFSVDLWLKYA